MVRAERAQLARQASEEFFRLSARVIDSVTDKNVGTAVLALKND